MRAFSCQVCTTGSHHTHEFLQHGHYKDGSFYIETDNPELVRKNLLGLTVQHNLNIVSLQTQSESLEEVFRSLTAPVVHA